MKYTDVWAGRSFSLPFLPFSRIFPLEDGDGDTLAFIAFSSNFSDRWCVYGRLWGEKWWVPREIDGVDIMTALSSLCFVLGLHYGGEKANE